MRAPSHVQRWSGVLAGACILALAAAPAFGQKKFLEKVRRHYQLDSTLGKCTLCHALKEKEDANRENLNAYGKEIQGHELMKPLLGKDDEYKFTNDELEKFLKVAQAIESKDSDGDGATNKEELDLGTFPGNKDSKPDATKLEKHRKSDTKK